jgi:hypothetical protein
MVIDRPTQMEHVQTRSHTGHHEHGHHLYWFLCEALSTQLTQQELPLWPNFLWNLRESTRVSSMMHFLWNSHKNMSFFFYDPIFYGTYTQHKSFHYDGIFFGTYTKTWVSMTQFSMELTQNTRVSIMMAFSLELTHKHEFLLLWLNFIWNLHNTICLTIF